MNNTIKQLQNEKKRKIKSMEMKEVKRYIERSVAYYYSHYMNFEDVYNSSDDITKTTENAMKFQKSFNENLDLIIESIQESYSEPSVKQMRLNYVLAVNVVRLRFLNEIFFLRFLLLFSFFKMLVCIVFVRICVVLFSFFHIFGAF